MKYQQPNIVSSFRKNNLGETLYNTVLMLKPKKIIEFGALHGYSSICMAMALHELGEGHIWSYDTWKTKEGWENGNLDECRQNAFNYGVEKFITYGTQDINKWKPEPFDLLYVDVNNDGQVLDELFFELFEDGVFEGRVMFEGGSTERDEVAWMKDKLPISRCMDYSIIDSRFPSLSLYDLHR